MGDRSEGDALFAAAWAEDMAEPLADWLEDHDDPRGPLLRKRWQKWQRDRQLAEVIDHQSQRAAAAPWQAMVDRFRAAGGNVKASIVVQTTADRDHADATFRRYVMDRFPESSPPLHDDA